MQVYDQCSRNRYGLYCRLRIGTVYERKEKCGRVVKNILNPQNVYD
jgi:hypothetical protein